MDVLIEKRAKMKYVSYLIRGIVAIYLITRISSYISNLQSAMYSMDQNAAKNFTFGFQMMMVVPVIILSVYALQNIVSFVIQLKYGRKSSTADDWADETEIIEPENSRPIQILNKIQGVLGQIYKIIFALIFAAMGIFTILYSGWAVSAVYIIPIIFILFALWVIIQSIKEIVLLVRG